MHQNDRDIVYQFNDAVDSQDVSTSSCFGDTLGESIVMQKLLTLLARFAPTDFPVLIERKRELETTTFHWSAA